MQCNTIQPPAGSENNRRLFDCGRRIKRLGRNGPADRRPKQAPGAVDDEADWPRAGYWISSLSEETGTTLVTEGRAELSERAQTSSPPGDDDGRQKLPVVMETECSI